MQSLECGMQTGMFCVARTVQCGEVEWTFGRKVYSLKSRVSTVEYKVKSVAYEGWSIKGIV